MNDVQTPMKAPVLAGGALTALVPQSLDEAYRVAQALSLSGDMVPKHFQGNPDMIMAAVMRGAEIGLLPMQALSNIAVINGRASIWGDALPALMQRAGHQLDCEVTGEGDAMVATATLVRGDSGQRIVRTFSVADAKAANLLGKPGPWQQYRSRMLSMRARSYACRDGAADALMGLQVAEESQDMTPIRDVTPRAEHVPLSQRIQAPTPQTVEADPIAAKEPEGPHWTESVAYDEAFPGAAVWDEGVKAFQAGQPVESCPYGQSMSEATDWIGGYMGAKDAAK